MFIKQIAGLIVTTAALNCVVAGPASAQYVNSGAMSAGTQTQGLDGQSLPTQYAGDGAGYVQSGNGAQASYTQAAQYNGQGAQRKSPWWSKLWHNRVFNFGAGGDGGNGGYAVPNNGNVNSGSYGGGAGSTGSY